MHLKKMDLLQESIKKKTRLEEERLEHKYDHCFVVMKNSQEENAFFLVQKALTFISKIVT